MRKRESTPEVNAGSMADIAFLLLIFFLVTTVIETDSGFERMLPRPDGEPIKHKKRNILSIIIDNQNQIMVNDELLDLTELRSVAISFLDNGGVVSSEVSYCDYCKGNASQLSSENPQKAIIAISHNRNSSYGTYITVQNELIAAYKALRNREANRLYEVDYDFLESQYQNPMTVGLEKTKLKNKIEIIRSMFPLQISEAELKTY